MTDLMFGAGFILFIVGVLALYVCWDSITATHGRITPHEQMRERHPWPPPSLPAQTVSVTYRRPEPLALPRGDR